MAENREKVSPEMLERAKTEGVVQQKPNGKWGVISIQAGEWWLADYDSKEAADAALKAYHAQRKGFDSLDDPYKTSKKWVVGHNMDMRPFMREVKSSSDVNSFLKNNQPMDASDLRIFFNEKLAKEWVEKVKKISEEQDDSKIDKLCAELREFEKKYSKNPSFALFDADIKTGLAEIKGGLLDAPSEVKLAFNDIVKYFGYESYEVSYYVDDKMYKVKVKSSSEEKAIDDVKMRSPDNAYGFKVLK